MRGYFLFLNRKFHLYRRLIFLIAFLLTTKCAVVIVHDNLPPGSSKGYIVFYVFNPSTKSVNEITSRVYEEKNAKQIDTGVLIQGSSEIERPVYFATRPGEYDFIIIGGRVPAKVSVKVLDGMMTPVRIELRNISDETIMSGTTKHITVTAKYSFDTNAIAGRPIPLTRDLSNFVKGYSLPPIRDSNAIEPLIDALNDKDWGVRWFAADGLGTMKELATAKAIERLIELSKNDPNALVREMARTALKKISKTTH